MNYFVVHRDDEQSRRLAERFHELADTHAMTLSEQNPDVVVSIGGDGTMLLAFHMFRDHLDTASFVGVHTGHLGFYADWMPSEIEQLVKLMHEPLPGNRVKTVHYPLIEAEVVCKAGTETHLALNEFTVKGIDATLVARLDINDEMFEMFRGDGICVSTPSGSTAYNKSLGGALVHPSLEAIQIAEIASINNRVFRTLGSPIILPKHHHCDIYPGEKSKLLLSVDHNHVQRDDIVSIRCRVAPHKIHFVRFRPFPFWNRVREAFIGHDPH